MTTPEQPMNTPMVTLTITDNPGEEDVTMGLHTHGVSLEEAAELIRQSLLNLDQKIWCERRGVRTSLSTPTTSEQPG